MPSSWRKETLILHLKRPQSLVETGWLCLSRASVCFIAETVHQDCSPLGWLQALTRATTVSLLQAKGKSPMNSHHRMVRKFSSSALISCDLSLLSAGPTATKWASLNSVWPPGDAQPRSLHVMNQCKTSTETEPRSSRRRVWGGRLIFALRCVFWDPPTLTAAVAELFPAATC